jgi:hypothetical protein
MSHINPDGTDIGTGEKRVPPLLHLYAGPSFHMEGYVVGNREGLTKLRDAINAALEREDCDFNAAVTTDYHDSCVFVSDGEGYDIYVIRQDTDWQKDPWDHLAVPYTAEDGLCQINEETAIWPHQLISDEFLERLRRGWKHAQGKILTEERKAEIDKMLEKLGPDDQPQDDY